MLAKHSESLGFLSLLDYGCERGETLGLATVRGMKAMGTDVDEECVDLSGKHGDTVKLTELHDPTIQFGEKSFDVVTCFHVLEHVDRPEEDFTALGKIARKYVVWPCRTFVPYQDPDLCAMSHGP